MLKVNVGMSRKLSKDYNSTGFSVNLDGEVCVGLDDPQVIVEKIKELYDVAEEALAQQIERYEGESAIAGRDQEPKPQGHDRAKRPDRSAGPNDNSQAATNGNGSGQANGNGQAGNGNAATNKQVQFLLNLGKRHGLTSQRLETRIEEILGRKVGVYQLTKQEAGQVIDVLNQAESTTAHGTGQGRNGR